MSKVPFPSHVMVNEINIPMTTEGTPTADEHHEMWLKAELAKWTSSNNDYPN